MKQVAKGRRKWWFVLLVGAPLAAVVFGLLAFKTPLFLADIRPESMGSVEQGRKTMRAIQRAHGGTSRWQQLSWVELEFDGAVPFPPARMSFGVPEEFVLRVRYEPAVPRKATIVIDGAEHAIDPRDANEGLALMTNAVRHLWELPFAMQSADVVHGLPDAQGHARVFASWGSQAPQMDTDQYVLWSRDGLVQRFYSTARVITPFTVSCVGYEDYRTVNGFELPGRVTVRGDTPDGRVVQRWTLRNVRLGPRRDT